MSINFNHLHYFWSVARLGSVTAAAKELHVAQPSISVQIKHLEQSLGTPLFHRAGRRLTLTENGQIVLRYADEIFRLGDDLLAAASGNSDPFAAPLVIGTSDAMPKMIVRALLQPALVAHPGLSYIFREWRVDHLLAELTMRRMDLVLTDSPPTPAVGRNTITYNVGSSGIVLCAAPALARKLKAGFPASLNDAPILLPADNTSLRESLNAWFQANKVRPRVIIEADDRSMLHPFASNAVGAVPVAEVTVDEVAQQFSLERVGVMRGVKEFYYAVAVERDRQHPAVETICSEARKSFQATVA
ncbi:MAG: LysR family transcriptional regulator [Phycisphaerales bacterium]|nr:LysR family transcriptional regulator [Phycisphaerales bacterium]